MKKKILIIGNGIKEYALAKKLSEKHDIYITPASDTLKEFAVCLDIREDSVNELLEFVLEKYNIPVFSYTPMEVKQVLTGYGRAEKKEVEQMVKIALQSEKLPKLDDTVDAIAIAICHSRNV